MQEDVMWFGSMACGAPFPIGPTLPELALRRRSAIDFCKLQHTQTLCLTD